MASGLSVVGCEDGQNGILRSEFWGWQWLKATFLSSFMYEEEEEASLGKDVCHEGGCSPGQESE